MNKVMSMVSRLEEVSEANRNFSSIISTSFTSLGSMTITSCSSSSST